MLAENWSVWCGGAGTPIELVWGIGMALWKREGTGSILKYPLITQVFYFLV
jgi:hypothetical protein